MCPPLKGFLLIVPLKATRDKGRFDFDSAVCSLSSRHVAQHRRGTAEIFLKFGANDFISITKLSPRCPAQIGENICSVLHYGEIDSVVCCTPLRQLCDRISQQNRNRIQKYFSLFIRSPDRFESWKKWRSNIL